jgi:hypothetical protein
MEISSCITLRSLQALLLMGALVVGAATGCASGGDASVLDDEGTTQLAVRSGERVVLDGGGLLSGTAPTAYAWTQLSGPSIGIADPAVATLEFIAPDVADPTFIVISLTVTQEEANAQTVYVVTVLPTASSEPDGGTYPPPPPPSPDAGSAPSGGTLTFTAVADGYVSERYPSASFGSDDALQTDQRPEERSYVKFSVAGITTPIHSATLRLFVTNPSSSGPTPYATGSAWNESALTWSSQPGPTSGALAPASATADDTWAEYDVSSAITGNGDVSFVLIPTSTDGADFASREDGTPPELIITF